MPKLKEIQGVLGANVSRLRKEYGPVGFRGMNKFAKLCGIGNSALKAIEDGTGNPELETLVAIAAKVGVEAWHLFIPGVNPHNKPRVLTPSEIELYLKFEKLVEERESTKQTGVETGSFPAYEPRQVKKAAFRRRKK